MKREKQEGTGEMELRTLGALLEDQVQFSVPWRQLTIVSNSRSRKSTAVFWLAPVGTRNTCGAQIYI